MTYQLDGIYHFWSEPTSCKQLLSQFTHLTSKYGIGITTSMPQVITFYFLENWIFGEGVVRSECSMFYYLSQLLVVLKALLLHNIKEKGLVFFLGSLGDQLTLCYTNESSPSIFAKSVPS